MSALAAPRINFMNKARIGRKIGRPAKSGKTFYDGALVAVGVSDGYLKPNDGTPGDKIVGIVDLKQYGSVATSGSDGVTLIDVYDGIFPFFIGSSGDALAQADVGNFVYAIDDQTVGKTDGGTGRPRVGQLISIESIGGVNMAFVAIGTEWALAAAPGGGVTEAISAAGAVSPTADITELSITGTMAFTIAAPATVGKRKVICTVAAASTPIGTLTSPASNGWTTVSGLGAVARSIELVANASLKWDLVGAVGVTVS